MFLPHLWYLRRFKFKIYDILNGKMQSFLLDILHNNYREISNFFHW